MEISETICEGYVEPSYKNTIAEANMVGHRTQMRTVASSSKNYLHMSNFNVKQKQRYVYNMRDRSKLPVPFISIATSQNSVKS